MKTFCLKIVLMIMLCLGLVCSPIKAHDEVIVHPGLTVNAIDLLNNVLINGYKNDIREGAIHEDDTPRWLQHGYDPASGKGWFWGSGIASNKAVELWNEAISAFNQGRLTGTDGAFHLLGRVAHLLEDMTSPAHTHSDIHLPRVPPLSEGDDFENWGKVNFSPIPGLSLVIPGDGSVETFIKSLALFTYSKTAWDGVIEERTGSQPNSTLKSMFPSLYWNDGGILGDNHWVIDNVGYFEAWGSDSWWACEGNYTEDNGGQGGVRRIQGVFYIENAGGNNGFLTPVVWEGAPNAKPLLVIWKEILYPECVRYTMGLLKKFVENVTPSTPPSPPSGLRIR